MQDIVTASYALDLDEFIPGLREYLTVVNPYKRQFLISWISVLASVPDIDMLQYLPELLEGLMGMLSDSNREIRQAAGKALQVSPASFEHLIGPHYLAISCQHCVTEHEHDVCCTSSPADIHLILSNKAESITTCRHIRLYNFIRHLVDA